MEGLLCDGWGVGGALMEELIVQLPEEKRDVKSSCVESQLSRGGKEGKEIQKNWSNKNKSCFFCMSKCSIFGLKGRAYVLEMGLSGSNCSSFSLVQGLSRI